MKLHQTTLRTAGVALALEGKVMNANNANKESSRRLNPFLVAGAAAAVTVFSLLGIAAITGALPGALAQKSAALPSIAVLQSGKSASCPVCGTVEAIRAMALRGDASGLGAVAGGLTGAMVGHQIGSGHGNTAMAVLGAAAGAYAGNEIEQNMKKRPMYRVTVRMDDGSFRTLSQSGPPAFAVGDKVRVVQGTLYAARS